MSNGEVIDCELSLDININNNYLFLLGYRKFDEIWSSQDYILGMNTNCVDIKFIKSLNKNKYIYNLQLGSIIYKKKNTRNLYYIPELGIDILYKINKKLAIGPNINTLNFYECNINSILPYYTHFEIGLKLNYNLLNHELQH